MITMNRFFVVDQFGKNLVTQFQILFFLFIHWLDEGQIDTKKMTCLQTHQHTNTHNRPTQMERGGLCTTIRPWIICVYIYIVIYYSIQNENQIFFFLIFSNIWFRSKKKKKEKRWIIGLIHDITEY